MPGEVTDFIFYDSHSTTIPVHLIHILLHEIAHMLLCHQTANVDTEISSLIGTIRDLEKDENQQAILGLFRSNLYSDAQEVEAETLSALIQAKVFRLAGIAALTQIGKGGEDILQFVQGLGFDR